MKKALTLTLLACGLALAQEAPKPEDPVVAALKAENTYFKEKVRLLNQKLILLDIMATTNRQLQELEAKAPKEEPVKITPPTNAKPN